MFCVSYRHSFYADPIIRLSGQVTTSQHPVRPSGHLSAGHLSHYGLPLTGVTGTTGFKGATGQAGGMGSDGMTGLTGILTLSLMRPNTLTIKVIHIHSSCVLYHVVSSVMHDAPQSYYTAEVKAWCKCRSVRHLRPQGNDWPDECDLIFGCPDQYPACLRTCCKIRLCGMHMQHN